MPTEAEIAPTTDEEPVPKAAVELVESAETVGYAEGKFEGAVPIIGAKVLA